MHCPQCGQQQAPGEVRFCSRCGFPLGGVTELMAHGGNLPRLEAVEPTEKKISDRRKGVQQGVMLIMLGIVLTPLLAVLSSYLGTPEMFVAISAIACFVGGPLRILYALIFEEGALHQPHYIVQQNYAPPPTMPAASFQPQGRTHAALPPQQSTNIPQWRNRPNTSELVAPPSITENTTRLLEKEPETPEG